jgi:TRAP transporter TAXI family solute receptor
LIDAKRRAGFSGAVRKLGRQLIWWLVLVTALTLAIWAVLQFVSPAPPRAIAMSTGPADGAYHHFGQRYQEILRANGVRLDLRTSSGGIENLQRLGDGSVSVGFVQGGTGLLALDASAAPESTPLRSLATVAFEPVWIFTHARPVQRAQPLAGKKVAVGVPGSGNHRVASSLLSIYGVLADNPRGAATLVSEGGTAAAELLERHEVDAAIIVAAPEAAAVRKLLSDGRFRLASLDHVEGLARRFPYFQPVSLKRGSVDPRRDLPPQDINLLATTANLVVRDDLHPALVYLLLEAARKVHEQPHSLRPDEFPARWRRISLSDHMERYQGGSPFLQSYPPFWVAVHVQRLALCSFHWLGSCCHGAGGAGFVAWRRDRRLFRRYAG